MKIITNEAIYVQLYDIAFLNTTDLEVPSSIYWNDRFIHGVNEYEFVRYDENCEIEFLKKLDYIVDYNFLKDLTKQEIVELIQKNEKLKNTVILKYEGMSVEQRSVNEHLVYLCDKLDFKINSLKTFLYFKQGKIDFILPEGIEYPKIINSEDKILKKILTKLKPHS